MVTDNTTFPRELMDAFIPPRTPSGTLLRRVDIRTFSEALLLVATGDIVHPTVGSILDHHGRPGIRTVPIRDLPPSRTALVWLAAREDLRIRGFAAAARDVLRDQQASPEPAG